MGDTLAYLAGVIQILFEEIRKQCLKRDHKHDAHRSTHRVVAKSQP